MSSRSYGAGARILSAGIALTGVVTFAYFSLASHGLDDPKDYGRIGTLWAVLFVTVTVLYRPIEQLLSRTIAQRRAVSGTPLALREPLLIQGGFALAFLITALALRGAIEDGLLDGSAELYWIFVGAVLAYAASYFARGWLAGNQQFELYGALVFVEATTRLLFAVAVVVGIASGQTAVALGMLAAPLVSLLVVPLAFSRSGQKNTRPGERDSLSTSHQGQQPRGTIAAPPLTLRAGAGFALAVLIVMVAEQTLINGAVLTTAAQEGATASGVVFSILLIARAPLQLFQAIQGSLLPHLAGLDATDSDGEFARAIRATLLAIAGFALLVALGLAALGPWAMDLLFPSVSYDWSAPALVVVAVGMGLHLAAGTLNQAALARGHTREAAYAWSLAGVGFLSWMLSPIIDDAVNRAVVGYTLAAGVLCASLVVVYRLRPTDTLPTAYAST